MQSPCQMPVKSRSVHEHAREVGEEWGKCKVMKGMLCSSKWGKCYVHERGIAVVMKVIESMKNAK